MSNEFPRLGIRTLDLIEAVKEWIEEARARERVGSDDFGAVNWGDLGVADIEYRLSMMDQKAKPRCVVVVEEASPGCELAEFLNRKLFADGRFPETSIECEW